MEKWPDVSGTPHSNYERLAENPKSRDIHRPLCDLYKLAPKNTLGFDPGELEHHFQKHGGRLHVATKEEYEVRADEMFVIPRPSDVEECLRPDGDLIRFNRTTQEYGVIDVDRVIRTFFLPIPCRSLSVENRLPGRCHNERSNLAYFKRNCSRRFI